MDLTSVLFLARPRNVVGLLHPNEDGFDRMLFAAQIKQDEILSVRWEPENEVDENACGVWRPKKPPAVVADLANCEARRVGFIRAEFATEVSRIVKDYPKAVILAKVVVPPTKKIPVIAVLLGIYEP